MQIVKNFDLTALNTFGVKAAAEGYASFASLSELEALLRDARGHKHFILGGGSNILLTGDINGLVLHNRISGIGIVQETDEDVYVQAGAGELWHDLVMYCVNRGLGGVENLSLIPGSVGASPMQNIGAYGVEIKDAFYELEAYHLQEGYVRKFDAAACRFGYRESVFKNELKDQFVILNVTYRLSRKPVFHISYGTVASQLADMGVRDLSVKAVSDAVIAIRRSKLPDPAVLGNAGSFFKNPVISEDSFRQLKKDFPEIHSFPADGGIKVPAAWLIEQCGFKGYKEGQVGCHDKQPLVIVNYGHATGQEIFAFSEKVIKAVEKKFGITLNREVNVV